LQKLFQSIQLREQTSIDLFSGSHSASQKRLKEQQAGLGSDDELNMSMGTMSIKNS
jgi:hypothetical protein